MKDVRKTIMERAAKAPAGTKMTKDVETTSSRRKNVAGGDRIDPRLFYFRALLEGDRFFGGGERS